MYYETVEKPEEFRVFFKVYEKKPREGEPVAPLTKERETALASLAKLDWESKNGKILYGWKFDPMAGGQHALVPPTDQVWRPYAQSREEFVGPGGPNFNQKYLDAGQPSNLKSGNGTMVSSGMWVGEYMA